MALGPRWTSRKLDRLRQLRAFCQAVEMKSITRGAAAIGLSQPTVSAHVRELEYEMEARLFERHGPHISLTPAGACLYEIAKPLVERLERIPVELSERLDESVSGELLLGAGSAAVSFVLPPLAKRFLDDYPGIRVRVRRVRVHESRELLMEGGVDCFFGTPIPSGDRSVLFHPIVAWNLVTIVPEDHPLAGRESVDIRELAEYPGIAPPAGTFGRDFGETIARRFGVEVNVGIETSGWGLVKRYVEAGLGISVVPSVCVSERDRLWVIPFGEYAKPVSYGVTIRCDVPLSPPARRFLEMLDPRFPFPT